MGETCSNISLEFISSLQLLADQWGAAPPANKQKGKQGLVTALTHLYSLGSGKEPVLEWKCFSNAILVFFHFREQRKLPKNAVLAAVQSLEQKKEGGFGVTVMFSKGLCKDRLVPASCLGSELIVLQIHKFCVRRGISTEIWVVLPKSASHWKAEERGCCFFASLCSFFQLEPLVEGFCWSGSHLSLERWIILYFHPMSMCYSCLSLFQPAVHLFLREVNFFTKKETIRDGISIDPKPLVSESQSPRMGQVGEEHSGSLVQPCTSRQFWNIPSEGDSTPSKLTFFSLYLIIPPLCRSVTSAVELPGVWLTS